jgi:hypothetical protein
MLIKTRSALLTLFVAHVTSQGAPVITLPNGSTLYASYISASSLIQYNVVVMPNTYLAIGYGTSMTNTDMAFWGANGTASVMYDMYSTGNKSPSIDSVNSYNTTFDVLANEAVVFTSTRPLDPASSTETFVIPIGTPINMICAYSNTTSSLSYHGSTNHFQWTLTFNSYGSATASGGLLPIQSGPLISLPNGS